MRALIIITLIVLILTVYFRYEKFTLSEARLKFPFFKVTNHKNKYSNIDLDRIKTLIKIIKSRNKFYTDKGKDFIFAGAKGRPVNKDNRISADIIDPPQMSNKFSSYF